MTDTKQRDTLEQQAQLLLELDRRKLKGSFYYFVVETWKQLDPHTPFIPNWHIKYLCYIAQMMLENQLKRRKALHEQILINICPRSLKSFIFNIAYPVWCWVKKDSLPIITASYALDLGLGFSRKSQALIHSNWFKLRFGDEFELSREAVQDTNTKSGGARYVASTEGVITGKGYQVGIVDDPHKASDARSAPSIGEAIYFYDESFYTRRNEPKTAFIFIIMQRIAQMDLSGHLIEKYEDFGSGTENKYLLHINLPLIKDGSERIPYKEEFLTVHPEETNNIYKDDFFFSDRFDEDFIISAKKRGTIFYNTQYMQNPLPSEGLLFKRDWFTTITKADYYKLKKQHRTTKNFVVDTAYTKNTLNDPSAILGYTTINGVTYIEDYKEGFIDSADLPEFIDNHVNNHGYDSRSIVLIEPKGSGMVVISLIKRLTKLNVTDYKYPKASRVNINMKKEERAHATTSMVESGKVVLVEGSYIEQFLNQVTTFPLNRHDEAVDTMVMAILRSHFIETKFKKFGLRLRK